MKSFAINTITAIMGLSAAPVLAWGWGDIRPADPEDRGQIIEDGTPDLTNELGDGHETLEQDDPQDHMEPDLDNEFGG